LIQDTFADALGVMVVITDIEGQPVTQFSHPCGLFNVISQKPGALQKCMESWYKLGQTLELEPKFTPSHLGLLCARAMIRVGTELKGMVVVGGVAPEQWPPSPGTIQAIASEFGLQPEIIMPHLTEVFYLNKPEQGKVLTLLQQIANVVAHIINERITLSNKGATL
jgi:ligand-binding sensor protein